MRHVIAIFMMILTLAASLVGCATTGTTVSDNSSALVAAEKFSAGCKWVLVVTDVMIPPLCAAGTVSPPICASYTAAASQLKKDLVTLDDLIAKGATVDTVTAAVSQAMATYLIVDAAYKGKLAETSVAASK